MAMYYAVEFPLEDSKSRGPYIVPENKVKVENGLIHVLWSVVNENGDVKEEFFEATICKPEERFQEGLWRIRRPPQKVQRKS